jgi:hypothetical protein
MFLSLDVGQTLAWLFGIPVCSVIILSLFWLMQVIYKKVTGKKKQNSEPRNEPSLEDEKDLYSLGLDYFEFVVKRNPRKWTPRVAQASPNKIRAGLIVLFSKILRNLGDWDEQKKTADECQRIFLQVPFVLFMQSKIMFPLENTRSDTEHEAWNAFIECISTKEKTAFVFDDGKIISEVLSKLPH